jgi:hypothetical protein
MNDSSQQDQGVLPVEEQWYDDQYNGDGVDLQQQQVDEYTETTMPMNTSSLE